MLASTVWRLIAAFFFAIAIVTGLGEWVFHWWKEPGEWMSPLSLFLAILSLGVSASSREVERMRAEQARRFDRLDQDHAEQTRVLQEQTRILQEHSALLREVVASFRAQPRS